MPSCEELDIEPLYISRLSQFLIDLENENFVDRKKSFSGHRGLSSKVTLLFDDPKVIVEAAKEIEWK